MRTKDIFSNLEKYLLPEKKASAPPVVIVIEIDKTQPIRCWNCGLNQFWGLNCRRCKKPLKKPEPEQKPEPQHVDEPTAGIGQRIRLIRESQGLSQRELAEFMGCPRTYISKIENGTCSPNLQQIARFWTSLNVSPADLLLTDRERDIRDTFADPFMQELIEAGKEMPSSYWEDIAAHARSLSLNRKGPQ